MKRTFFLTISFMLLLGLSAFAQKAVTTPPSGLNMGTTTQQQMGLVNISVSYHSPDVSGREGKIWGQLVPWGTTDFVAQGFGTSTEGPWRAGANENTTITFSEDVKVEGKSLKAGTYGLHFIPQENKVWTVIFSKNSTAWGSYFYDAKDDALRVQARAEAAPLREYLIYDFIVRKLDTTVLAMHWEKLRLPITISHSDMKRLYVENMRRELQSTAGFSWVGLQSAANYCANNNINLEEALTWAETSTGAGFVGTKNFATLQTKAQLLDALGRSDESKKVMWEAMDMATNSQVYFYGAGLMGKNDNEAAFKVFDYAAKKDPDHWLSHAGLAAKNRVLKKTKKALEHYKKAQTGAPAQWKPSFDARIKQLEKAN